MIGDTVLARWSDTRYYQGKIRAVNSNGSYRVRFYDGLEKSVQAGNIREMPEELRLIVSPKVGGIVRELISVSWQVIISLGPEKNEIFGGKKLKP